MKTYRSMRAAHTAANGQPVLRLTCGSECLYIVYEDPDPSTSGIDLIGPKGHLTGTVTLRHLDRLGNANWAKTDEPRGGRPYSFPNAFKELTNV